VCWCWFVRACVSVRVYVRVCGDARRLVVNGGTKEQLSIDYVCQMW